MGKKKKKKYNIWLGDDDYRADKVDEYLDVLQPTEVKSEMGILNLHTKYCPGFFFGTERYGDLGRYIGMPQGEEGNILVIGGNGSGKSAGIAKPTLRTWKGALCVTDIKGELSDYYKELYSQDLVDHPYIIFDPMCMETLSYDPFWWLLKDDAENLVGNIWEIVLAIMPVNPDDREPFWTETEQGLFAAELLHYFKLGLSFSESICQILTTTVTELRDEILDAKDTTAQILLGDASKLKPELLAAVDRGLRNKLMLFVTEPHISHAFRGVREGAACFNWDDLEKYTIFLRIPADKIEVWGGAINLMYTQLIRYLERRPDKFTSSGSNNLQTLLLMDEFARFGKLQPITNALSTLRSKNVNICLIIQSMAQLDRVYGQNNRRIILDNCQYQAILRANDAETQKYLAELIGTRKSIQTSLGQHADELMDVTGYSRQITEIREWTIHPHELSTLNHILLRTPYGFYQIEKTMLHIKEVERRIFPMPERIVGQVISMRKVNEKEETDKDGTAVVPRITVPARAISVKPKIQNIRKNEGAKMLTTNERAANAQNRIEDKKQKEKTAKQQEKKAVTKKNQRRNYIVGELVTKYFPELLELEPGTKDENAVTFKPLEQVLCVLAADQQLMQKLLERASQIILSTED